MAQKRANNEGTIRQRKDGTWEVRITLGTNPGTGKPIRKSIYGKTQNEVLKKKTAVLADIDKGIYAEPSKLSVSKWLDIWLEEYSGGIREGTKDTYKSQIKVNIKPALGAVKLSELKPYHIQKCYNDAQKRADNPLNAKSIKNVNGVLHKALQQALKLNYIPVNPCDAVQLPKVQKKEIKPLEEKQLTDFLAAIKGSEYETLLKVDLFTGMRQGEIMGLTWDRVDFKAGTILVDRQMILEKKKGGKYKFAPTKTGQIRRIKPAPSVMALLQARRKEQAQHKLLAGSMWNEGDFAGEGLVFTSPLGNHYSKSTLTHNVTKIGERIGMTGLRFHDLRHTYAVSSIRAGDDIKTISSNLGHSTVAMTLDTYAHFTDDMRNDSADRMEKYLAKFGGF